MYFLQQCNHAAREILEVCARFASPVDANSWSYVHTPHRLHTVFSQGSALLNYCTFATYSWRFHRACTLRNISDPAPARQEVGGGEKDIYMSVIQWK
jgi:hypothetical protein